MKGYKISILGAGRVGSSLAYTLVNAGTCSELVLVDIAKDLAEGEAMDIDQGVPFLHETYIHAGDYADVAGSDIIVVTLGAARKPGQSRIELAQGNVNIIKSVMPEVAGYAPDATYIIVSNPVDILTYATLKVTNLSPAQVIGSGTQLDSARLKTMVGNATNVASNSIHAFVMGEHGDTSFIPESGFHIAGMSLHDYCSQNHLEESLSVDELEHNVKIGGGEVIRRKGATNYAIAASVGYICQCIRNNTKNILLVSTLLDGQYGISDVCLSMPTVVGEKGFTNRLTPPLNDAEMQKLTKSANALKEVIAGLTF